MKSISLFQHSKSPPFYPPLIKYSNNTSSWRGPDQSGWRGLEKEGEAGNDDRRARGQHTKMRAERREPHDMYIVQCKTKQITEINATKINHKAQEHRSVY